MSIFWFTIGIIGGAIVSHLIFRAAMYVRDLKRRAEANIPEWERMALHYEEVAREAVDETINCTELGATLVAQQYADRATSMFRKAEEVRNKAIEEMMKGKIL